MQIIDLSNLPNSVSSDQHEFWTKSSPGIGVIGACHNIFIEEATGIAYLSGCSVVNGGVIMIDVKPAVPVYLGITNNSYSHDVYVRNDTLYSSDLEDGVFSVHDVKDKTNPQLLANQRTPFQFTHNTWLSDDGNTIFTTDELGDAPIGAYDISDLDDIKLINQFYPEGTRGTRLIPHNVHVKNDFLITSYYTEGVVITDASRPHNLVQVGQYDTFEGPNGSFEGVWGAFPFFESNIVLISDQNEGLFILQPNYQRASFFEGIVRDSVTGEELSSVNIDIVYRGQTILESRTGFDGKFELGTTQAGLVEVTFSKPDYKTRIIEVDLQNGALANLSLNLLPTGVSIAANNFSGCAPHQVTFSTVGAPINSFEWVFEGGTPATSTAINPTITYDQAGTYGVKLLTSLEGSPLEIQQNGLIRVTDIPTADFSFRRDRNVFTFTNLSENADSYFWDFGNGDSSTEENPIYQFVGGALSTVTLTTTNDCGNESFAINLGGNTTSLESLNLLSNFSASPNPFSEYTTIQYEFTTAIKEGQFLLMDISGQVLETISFNGDLGSITIDKVLPKGVYFGQLRVGSERSAVLKLVVL